MARKQESGKDTKEYYIDKMRIWIQVYSSGKRSLVEFKDEMLMGLYDAELTETCLFFMPKELQHKNKIKALLDNQLSHDIKELKATYTDSFKKVENSKRSDKM